MLPEISLNVLDIAQNSIKAEASLVSIKIQIHTTTGTMALRIEDNGCGMDEEQQKSVTDPFFTSRTTRKVGLGVPFLKQSAECTGGTFSIQSQKGQGTKLTAEYHIGHIDFMPLGDITATIYSLIIMNDNIDFVFEYEVDERGFVLDTRQIREIAGDAPLNSLEISTFIKEYLEENKLEVDNGNIF